ncbi:MCE family protein [Nocardioides humilatus]|nr:MCE family protein [Nocardioides humilatus]
MTKLKATKVAQKTTVKLGKKGKRPVSKRRSFSEMDLGKIGLVGLILTGLLLAGALNIGKLLELVNSSTYTADLAEAGGLRSGDDVRVAGIKVGKVNDVELMDDHVEVSFGLEDIDLGDETRAIVKSDNALGSKFLALEPKGDGDESHIPLERTDAGFAVNEELGELTTSTAEIDEDRLAESFASVSAVLEQTPEEFRGALKGVGKLSNTLSSRDDELARLLQKASNISGLLADRNKDITQIMSDGSLLFDELTQRREILGDLLRNVQRATAQLVGLARDNKLSLKPALTELKQSAELLADYRDTLAVALKTTGGYIRSLGESVAGGPFFQAYVANLGSPEDLGTGGIAGLLTGEGSF